MKKFIFTCFCAISLLLCAQDSRTFKEPPQNFRPIPLWFWNNALVEAQELEVQIEMMRNKDFYGGFAILPFGKNFKPEYLSEDYFKIYEVALKKAKSLGMKISLYDEYGFPSGGAGTKNADGVTRFKNAFPRLTIKRLDKIEYEALGKKRFEQNLSTTPQRMALVAMEKSTKKLIDLTPTIIADAIVWDAPEGDWLVMEFVCIDAGENIMDYLSKDAARAFVRMIHDEYYKRFGEYFGSVIESTFFDEPTLYRALGRSWTDTFDDEFKEKFGYSPNLLYPALWYDIGESTAAARNAMFSFRSDLYAEAYPKIVSEWASKHGIKATGHQDNEERENPVGTSGDLMKCFKYQDIAGVDKIGGNRPAEDYYKVISSAALNWDKSLVMSETYGAMGNISWDEIYSVALDQFVKGINVFIPHAVWYDVNNVRFPPELSWRNPLYKDELPNFNKFISRMQLMMQNDARTVADIAVLYPISSMQAEHKFGGELTFYEGGVKLERSSYVEISKAISNELMRDFVFLHPEVLDSSCELEGKILKLKNRTQFNDFAAIIIPSMHTISIVNLEKICAFYEAGGTVIFDNILPEKSAEFGKDDNVKNLIRKIFGKEIYENVKESNAPVVAAKGDGKAIFLRYAENKDYHKLLSKYLPKRTDIEFLEYSSSEKLKFAHKILGSKNLYFFANTSATEIKADILFKSGVDFEILNPHTGEVSDANVVVVPYLNSKEFASIKITLGAFKGVFVREK